LTPWDYLIEDYLYGFQELRCVSTFYTLGSVDEGYILLGAAFLNGLNAVFNADRKSISFGN
jgi:saccharopepsin